MECETCKKMTDWYLTENPKKNGYVLCESCYEKSKEYICYMEFPYQPERTNPEEHFKKTFDDYLLNPGKFFKRMEDNFINKMLCDVPNPDNK